MSSPAVPLARAKAAGWLRSFVRAAIPVVTGTCVIAIALVLTQQLSGRSPFVGVALALIAVLPIWMFFSTSYGATLAVLALYLGLIDGVLKLTLNSPGATLGRDVLLYSIVIGALARIAISSRPVRFPPLTGYILAFVAIVLVQVLNPQTGGLGRGLAATRPHLEFIPLFFFGFVFMRDTRRLRIFLLLLCAIAAVNGAVGLVQFNLTPDELASWGPGYAERINGTGDLSSRKFRDEATNQEFNRPFALGPDIGFGGAVGIIAVPAFLALLGTARRRWSGRIGVPLGVGIVLAVATSQSRTAVVGAIVAALAFGAFSLLSQRRATALIGLAAAVVLTVLGISLLSGGDNRAALSRYNSIAPSKVLDTTCDYAPTRSRSSRNTPSRPRSAKDSAPWDRARASCAAARRSQAPRSVARASSTSFSSSWGSVAWSSIVR